MERPAQFSHRDGAIQVYLLALVLIGVLACAARLAAYSGLEPRVDQAFFARWVQEVRRADHLMPQRLGDESWVSALNGDSSSALNQLLRRIGSQGIRVFGLVSIGTVLLGSLLFGDSYRAMVGMSIGASALVVYLVGLWPFWRGRFLMPFRGAPSAPLLGGLAAAGAAATSFYLHAFSPWGWHNFGVLYLLLAIVTIDRIGGRIGTEGIAVASWLATIPVLALALYSQHAVALFLPLAAAGYLFALPEGDRRARLALGISCLASTAILLAPAALVIVWRSSGTSYALIERATIGQLAGEACMRAGGWFVHGVRYVSLPGLLTGLAGLVVLARMERRTFPLWVMGSHFLVWTLLPGFSDLELHSAKIRTYTYIVPLLCVGLGRMAMAAAALIRFRRDASRGDPRGWKSLVLGWGLLALIAAHLVVQLGPLTDPERLRRRVPQFGAWYLEGQGTLRRAVAAIDAIVPEGGVLLSWDYALQDLYATLTESQPRRLVLLPPVDVMDDHAAAGDLHAYLTRRRIRLVRSRDLFVLARTPIPGDDLKASLESVLGERGLGWGSAFDLARVGTWQTAAHDYDGLTLVRVSRAE